MLVPERALAIAHLHDRILLHRAAERIACAQRERASHDEDGMKRGSKHVGPQRGPEDEQLNDRSDAAQGDKLASTWRIVKELSRT